MISYLNLLLIPKKQNCSSNFCRSFLLVLRSAKNPINQIHQQEIAIYSSSIDATMSNQVDTRRRFNVYKTSYRRLTDAETTSCVYWEKGPQHKDIISIHGVIQIFWEITCSRNLEKCKRIPCKAGIDKTLWVPWRCQG